MCIARSFGGLLLDFLRAEPDVVYGDAEYPTRHRQIAQPLQRALPDADHQRDLRIFRQASISLRVFNVVENVHHMRSTHARRIVQSGILVRSMFPELRHTLAAEFTHIFFAAEMQAAGGTSLYTRRFQARAHAVRTQSALVNLFRLRVEFRDVEWTAGDAVLASDAVVLLKIHNAIRVLNNGSVGWTGAQAARVGAVQAAILAHQPAESSIFC